MVAEPVPLIIDQVPPATASVKAAVVEPTQTDDAPLAIAAGATFGLTVSGVETVFPEHPVVVYSTVTVPALTPVTTPVCAIVAEPDPLIIDQVPPGTASVKAAVVEPTQTDDAPLAIAAGATFGLTVSGVETVFPEHPVVVYSTVTVPALTPVTTPVCAMVAEPVPLTIDQVPPATASVKAAVVEPTQTDSEPLAIAAGATFGLTVSGVETVFPEHPVVVYSTVTVPALTPVTTPPCVMVAEPVPSTIDQVPPATASVKAAVVEPRQTDSAPLAIAAGATFGLTVSGVETVFPEHPLVVYSTVTVPALTPVTTPICAMVAVPVPLIIDQVPPATASVKAAVVEPTQTDDAPLAIAAGATFGLTVSGVETVFPEHPVVVYSTVTVPALTPVTTPVCAIVAEPDPLTIDQVPPAIASVNAGVVAPTQTVDAPSAIGPGVTFGFTVRAAKTVLDPQPVIEYSTITEPAVKPVTIPPWVMLAVPVPLIIDHVPPPVPSVKAGVVPF